MFITEEVGQVSEVVLSSGELIAFGRIYHSVQMQTRKKDRLTINAFF